MSLENQYLLKDLKKLNGSLGEAICGLGVGGDGHISLHTWENDDDKKLVAVKSVSRQDLDWQKYVWVNYLLFCSQ